MVTILLITFSNVFSEKKLLILIKLSLKFVCKCAVDNKSSSI